MNALPPTTQSRLQKIPQTTAVWEGDRRCLGSIASMLDSELESSEECIIWVDGSEGAVRAMEMVAANTGPEAVVRILLKAIESPQHPAQPARPHKIVICDRQLQFFLRGALQGLNIEIEYAADLPLIDELFRGFEIMGKQKTPRLPTSYERLLEKTARQVWRDTPWEVLADSDILTIEFQNKNIEPIYACIMGMMSAEYGILLYRSLESLKQFRFAALSEHTPEALEKAFLSQNCWFLNYELEDDEANQRTEITPLFGSLHPFEGMRGCLDEEEAKIVYLALEALLKFCNAYRDRLAAEIIPALNKTYRLDLPKSSNIDGAFSISIATYPELTTELLAMEEEFDELEFEDEKQISISLQEDLIPEGSLVTLGQLSWGLLDKLKQQYKTYYQNSFVSPIGQELPAILIQTSRPKAQTIIETIKQAGGLQAICFNPGSDPSSGETYDLGMLQTGNSNLYIFAEYPHHIKRHAKALQKWHQNCQQTKGYCSLVITMGVTGANRGNPQLKDMLAVFEARAISGEELGMGVLELMPTFDFE